MHHALVRAAAAVALFAISTSSHAIFRAYLASDGNDANPCTVQLPCRLLPAAIAAVDNAGEIWMLDSANFNSGPVAVNKSVTILAIPGAVGSVVALGGNAINIDTAGVSITLRNITIRPFPGNTSATGILVSQAGKLVLEQCQINGFSGGYGLRVSQADTDIVIKGSKIGDNSIGGAFDGAKVAIDDTIISGNGTGIYAQATVNSTLTDVALTRFVLAHNTYGIVLSTSASLSAPFVRVVVADSLLMGHGNTAVHVTAGLSTTNPQVDVIVKNSVLSQNFIALRAENTGARIVLTGNTITRNTSAYTILNGGIVQTAGNNAIVNNSGQTGSLTSFALQ